uniref:Pentraxin 3 n=1 Tax=Hippocampus comes TaxID=109280 RepID=A0A3Q2XX50_HIPCM
NFKISAEFIECSFSFRYLFIATPSSTPCRSPDLTKWDKIFSMLENSQMRENMLLQYADDIVKVEMGSLQRLKFGDYIPTADGNSVGSSNNLEAMLQQLLSATRSQATRLGKLETKQEVTSHEVALEAALAVLQQTRMEIQEVLSSSRRRHLPAGNEMAILFPMRSRRIYTSVIPDVPLSLSSFTVCLWVKPVTVSNKTVLLSYGNRRNPYEIQLLLSHTSALFTIGGETHLVEARGVVDPKGPTEWLHLCGSWSSEQGLASLWAGGKKVASTPGVAEGHILPDGGSLQLGQERNGCCPLTPRFDPKLAFAGTMTGVNMWDKVLPEEKISLLALKEGQQGCEQRGNIVAWGVTEMVPHGGALFIN